MPLLPTPVSRDLHPCQTLHLNQPIETHSILLYDAQQQQWLYFSQPIRVAIAHSPSAVMPLLETVHQGVQQGYYAAGFLSYEAAPAFDASLVVQPCEDFPLAWFGLYAAPQIVALPDVSAVPLPTLDWTPTISQDRYQQAIQQIKTAIAQGDTYQVNYSFRLRSPFPTDPLAYFMHLIQAQSAQYSAFVNLDNWAICCASPELFFDWQDGTLASRPMKGTAARGLTYDQDRAIAHSLRHSAKNQAENLMIVDMIRNDMGRIADIGSVHVPHLFDIEQYPTLWQMTSPVQCRTAATLPEIFQSLFPCASITGAPKHSTMNIIANLEESPRRIYTGTIGFVSPHHTAQFNVAIRTVLVNKRHQIAEYGVGGGIVWDSEAADEYSECCTKAQILTQHRPKFDLIETLLWEPSGYFLLDLHLQRLQQSAAYFNFPINIAAIHNVLQKLSQNSLWTEPQRIRLTLSATGDLRHEVSPLFLADSLQPIRLGISPVPVDATQIWLYHKTTHRLIYDTARQALPDVDDVLLWNQHGEVTESCIANFIFEIEDQLYTPPVSCGLLPGIYRQWLLQQGQIQERVLPLDELPRCTRWFTINSVRKMRPAIIDG
jgi:para-aminobenzoate synthetase / 4-amino-4-deoxychorismate lyase